MPVHFDSVFVSSTGLFMPGEPVGNDDLDRYIAPLNAASARIKRRILAENGIKSRHYAIADDGSTVHSATAMAAAAVNSCLSASEIRLEDLTVLCTGSSGGDVAMPGFANMVQGALARAPVAYEQPPRCLRGWRRSSAARGEHTRAQRRRSCDGRHQRDAIADVQALALRSARLRDRLRLALPAVDAVRRRRRMLAQQATARARTVVAAALDSQPFVQRRPPVCMQIGHPPDGSQVSYLDYASVGDAEADGAFLLRQDIRLLPHLFELGIHEYVQLIHDGAFVPEQIDHFLCHYSSQKFAGVVEDLMARAGLSIPRERWYSNLTTRGNTGAASIFIMLADFLRERELQPGQRILCFVPESGRFTVAFMMFEVVQSDADASKLDVPPPHLPASAACSAAAHAPDRARLDLARLSIARLAHDHDPQDHDRAVLARRLRPVDGMLDPAGARRQPVDAHRCCAPRRTPRRLAQLVRKHAGEEQFDFKILFDDYRRAGGDAPSIDALVRNPGGEALNSYMHALARQPNPIGLLGAIYIIEGTGQRIIPALLPLLRKQLDIPEQAFRFLAYHGENDASHLARWLTAVEMALELDPADAADRIATVARSTAELYLLQMEHVI